jgi:hypothetical protein
MAATVLLADIVEVLEMQFDERPSFVDLDTGQVETVAVELLRKAEELADDEEPEIPEWQKPEFEAASRVAFGGRFRRLPSNFDVNEWAIMEEFSLTVESARIREDLLQAIRGKGAFRYFKDTIRRYRIESDWYEFRMEALRQIARDWCEEHHIACRE